MKACAGTERGLRSQLAEACAALFATQVQQERGITCGWVAGCGSLTYFGSRMAGRRASTDAALTDQLARTFPHVASELAKLRAEVDCAVVKTRSLAEQAAARPADSACAGVTGRNRAARVSPTTLRKPGRQRVDRPPLQTNRDEQAPFAQRTAVCRGGEVDAKTTSLSAEMARGS